MANPNIICTQSVTLSSNAILLPAESSPSVTTYTTWTTSGARSLLTNPAGSNKVLKITSLVIDHGTTNIQYAGPVNVGYLPVGVSIYVTSATANGSLASVKAYRYGAISQTFVQNAQSSSFGGPVGINTFGPPNYEGSVPVAGPYLPSSSTNGQSSLFQQTKSLVCSPQNPLYLTENESLWGVSRVVTSDVAMPSYFSAASYVYYSFEEISD